MRWRNEAGVDVDAIRRMYLSERASGHHFDNDRDGLSCRAGCRLAYAYHRLSPMWMLLLKFPWLSLLMTLSVCMQTQPPVLLYLVRKQVQQT